MFSVTDFDNNQLNSQLHEAGIEFSSNNLQSKIGPFGYVKDVKIDLVKHHNFKQIDEPVEEGGIRMFGNKDIIVMKIFAILQRAKKKDFWDLAELFK